MYWVRRCGCMSLQDLEVRCPEAQRLWRAVQEAERRYNEACAALHHHLYGPDEGPHYSTPYGGEHEKGGEYA